MFVWAYAYEVKDTNVFLYYFAFYFFPFEKRDGFSCLSSWLPMYYINEDGLDFLMFMPLLHKCTDYRHVPPFLVLCGTEPADQGFTQCR